MEHYKRGSIIEVITIDGGRFVLSKDLNDQMFRWVNLEFGVIEDSRYPSVEEALQRFKGLDAFIKYHNFTS